MLNGNDDIHPNGIGFSKRPTFIPPIGDLDASTQRFRCLSVAPELRSQVTGSSASSQTLVRRQG